MKNQLLILLSALLLISYNTDAQENLDVFYRAQPLVVIGPQTEGDFSAAIHYQFTSTQALLTYRLLPRVTVFGGYNFDFATSEVIDLFVENVEREKNTMGYTLGVGTQLKGTIGGFRLLEVLGGYSSHSINNKLQTISDKRFLRNEILDYSKIFVQFNMVRVEERSEVSLSLRTSYFTAKPFDNKVFLLEPAAGYSYKPFKDHSRFQLTSQFGISASLI